MYSIYCDMQTYTAIKLLSSSSSFSLHAQEIYSVHFSKVKILIPEKNNASNIEEHEQSLYVYI